MSFLFVPEKTHASIFSIIADKVKSLVVQDNNDDEISYQASQNMNVLKPNVVDTDALHSADVDENSDDDTLQATLGTLRLSTEDIDFPTNDSISLYEVKKGDSLAKVAKMFGVSKNTIIWANNLKSENITPGDALVILPMTGIKHTVKKGDTISSIAKKYKADAGDIASFNGLSKDSSLALNTVILVPEGEISIVPVKGKSSTTSKLLNSYSYGTPSGFLIRPIVGGRKTQGLHGHNGVDLASSLGTPVLASAEGTVIVAKVGGYNGGYGNMIVISHNNNIQTVYAHLRAVNVTVGQVVSQGQVIGELGNTGRSTGPHLHFEVRGAKNPF